MEVEFPDDFRCPISLEVMSDPVILTSGHTFDRSSIQRWLDSGNRTCPVTKLPLPPHPRLIPNHALRNLISNFAPDPPSKLPSCHSAADPQSLSFPSDAATLSAAFRRAKLDAAFRRYLADSGAASSVLLRHAASPDPPDLQELSLRVLLLLSLDGDHARVGLAADGAVDLLLPALRCGGSVAALAATTLTSLAVVDVNKCSIGAHPSAIPSLVAVLRDGKGRERREAATALFVLCSLPENRKRAAISGAVPALASLASLGSDRAVEVLGMLVKCSEGREAMKRIKGFVEFLIGIIKGGSLRATEHALVILNFLCCDDKNIILEVRKQGLVEICINLMNEETGKIRENAVEFVRTMEM
ncbi:Zinc finger RING/FYVE/PHD-type protein [Dioscorea alata]|uniref:Zinc finger RING/FYVE/PHD-type protein n=1 Tax=Dioscorea alata TaxID=55571 RepID=A0ACB7TY40_DIOAL|nr:Zinc finger RING/FYVE/PHD-type protein [Dioscorea alata]